MARHCRCKPFLQPCSLPRPHLPVPPVLPLFFAPFGSLTLRQVRTSTLLEATRSRLRRPGMGSSSAIGSREPSSFSSPFLGTQSAAEGTRQVSLTSQACPSYKARPSPHMHIWLPGYVPTPNLFKGPLPLQWSPPVQAWVERENRPRGSRKLLPVDADDLDDALPCASPCGLFMPQKSHVSG